MVVPSRHLLHLLTTEAGEVELTVFVVAATKNRSVFQQEEGVVVPSRHLLHLLTTEAGEGELTVVVVAATTN